MRGYRISAVRDIGPRAIGVPDSDTEIKLKIQARRWMKYQAKRKNRGLGTQYPELWAEGFL